MIFFALIILACKDKEPTYDKTSYPIKIRLINYFKDIPSNIIDSMHLKEYQINMENYEYFLDGLELYLELSIPDSIPVVKLNYNLASYLIDDSATAVSLQEDSILYYASRNVPRFSIICSHDRSVAYNPGIHLVRMRVGINIDSIVKGFLIIRLPIKGGDPHINEWTINYTKFGIYFPILNGELIKGTGTLQPAELTKYYDRFCKDPYNDCPLIEQPILFFGAK